VCFGSTVHDKKNAMHLMIKFRKAEKSGSPVSYFETSGFHIFRTETGNEVKHEDLRIPMHLRHEKWVRSIRN
jgi:hypothetical protein